MVKASPAKGGRARDVPILKDGQRHLLDGARRLDTAARITISSKLGQVGGGALDMNDRLELSNQLDRRRARCHTVR